MRFADGSGVGAADAGLFELDRELGVLGGADEQVVKAAVVDGGSVHDAEGGAFAQLGGGAVVGVSGQVVGDGAFEDESGVGVDGIGCDACAAQADFFLNGEGCVQVE